MLIVRIGDEGPEYYKRDLNKFIESIGKYIVNHAQLIDSFAFPMIIQAISKNPTKGHIYAAMVGLLHQNN
jgi:hypothetical protein